MKLKVGNQILRFFRVLHPVGKQTYKLELLKKYKIQDVFYISVLEHNITKKGQIDKSVATQLEFESNNDKENKLEVIWDSVVYEKKSEFGHLPGLYYLSS